MHSKYLPIASPAGTHANILFIVYGLTKIAQGIKSSENQV